MMNYPKDNTYSVFSILCIVDIETGGVVNGTAGAVRRGIFGEVRLLLLILERRDKVDIFEGVDKDGTLLKLAVPKDELLFPYREVPLGEVKKFDGDVKLTFGVDDEERLFCNNALYCCA